VLAAFAQFDNDVRSDRTRAGMRAALVLGRWTFPAPLGYSGPGSCRLSFRRRMSMDVAESNREPAD
jgi:DNA invertase Pin-like site-specific DNA recombinase